MVQNKLCFAHRWCHLHNSNKSDVSFKWFDKINSMIAILSLNITKQIIVEKRLSVWDPINIQVLDYFDYLWTNNFTIAGFMKRFCLTTTKIQAYKFSVDILRYSIIIRIIIRLNRLNKRHAFASLSKRCSLKKYPFIFNGNISCLSCKYDVDLKK